MALKVPPNRALFLGMLEGEAMNRQTPTSPVALETRKRLPSELNSFWHRLLLVTGL